MTPPADLRGPPNRLPWPPLIFAGAALAAVLLGWLAPTGDPLPGGPALRVAGGVLILAGVGLDLSAMWTMRRHRANILPHRAATALVTSGPFALSRNPIYLGNLLLLTGAAFAWRAPWFLAAAAVAAPLLTWLAIRREEAHLAALFGEAWQAYARRTGRWL